MRTSSYTRLLVVALALGGCAATGDDLDAEAQEARRSDLQVSLALGQPAYAAHERVVATVTITNAGKSPVRLLSWMLPAPDLEEPLFRVARGGVPADFVGPHYKRPPAGDADYVKLAAGATLVRTVDLGAFYDLSRTGDYAIRLETPAASNTAGAWIEGRTEARQELRPDAGGGTLGFSGCAADQQQLISDAAAVATAYADEASSYLGKRPSATARYTTWFGAFSDAGWAKADDDFAAIADAFHNAPVVVDCGCKKKYYAYVFPNRPYEIFVCKVFWSAPTSGTDSKAGTLIHEMSHFDVTAGTDDWAYGKTACMDLALSDPTRALDNADSHEYFAENTPALR